MKKLLLIGLGCLAFTAMGAMSKAEAGVQVSLNFGSPRPYYRPAPVYYDDCGPQVVYRRPVVVYSRPPAYYYYGAPAYAYSRPYPYHRR